MPSLDIIEYQITIHLFIGVIISILKRISQFQQNNSRPIWLNIVKISDYDVSYYLGPDQTFSECYCVNI